MNKILIGILSLLLAAACARENEFDKRAFEEGAFARWMTKYHPNVPESSDDKGIYIEWLAKNPDGARLRESYWLEMDYTVRDQNGDIFYTRSRRDARLLFGSSFDYSVHYAPELAQYYPSMLIYSYPSGQIRLLQQLNEGDSVRLYLAPEWGYSGYGFTYSKASHFGFALPNTRVEATMGLIVDLRLNRVIKDIDLYEREQVTRWAADSLGITDPADSIALGVYFKKTIENPTGEEVEEDSKINVYYTARFLDGHIFDTNIESVARAHGVLASDGPTTISLPSISENELPADPTHVMAIKTALLQMKSWEGARFVFVSDQGFMSKGHTSSSDGRLIIPPYTPLEYEIYIENVVDTDN